MATHDVAIDDAAWHSPWRRRRVGDKVLVSLALVVTALFSPPFPGCVLVLVAALWFMLGPAQIRSRLVVAAAAAPVVFVLIGTLPVVAQWTGRGFTITRDGLERAGELWAHSLSGTLAVIMLATTTPMVDLLTWLRRLRIPDPLLEVASLTYRLVFLLLGTTLALREAQQARLVGAAPLRRRWQATGSALGTVMVMTWQRAARLQEGLEGRGYEDSLRTLAPRRDGSRLLLAQGAAVVALVWAANVCWWTR